MRTAVKMTTVLRKASVSSIVAPVINAEAVIGVALDAGDGYTSYQWQSSSDGATWADVSGATAQIPVSIWLPATAQAGGMQR